MRAIHALFLFAASAACAGDDGPPPTTCDEAPCPDDDLPVEPDEALGAEIAAFIAAHERVPDLGVAVAVVRAGVTVHLGVYGLRDRSKGLAVTTETLFAIGSSSKPFAGLSAVLEAQAGALDLDAPVRAIAPDFALADEATAAQTSLVDLLSHQSGLSPHDSLWLLTELDRKELFARLRHLPLRFPPRTTFQYNNLGIMSAAVVVGRSAEKPWEDYAREAILAPLGMTATVLSAANYDAAADHAIGYRGEPPMPLTALDDVGPAGSIGADIRDMTRWARFLAAGGALPAGSHLLEPGWFETWIEPRIDAGVFGGTPYQYALGWLVSGDRAAPLVEHEGGAAGFLAHVSFRPVSGDAVVILSNQHGTMLPTALAKEIHAYLAGVVDRFDEPAREELVPFEPLIALPDAHRPATALDAGLLVGVYEHAAYGRITVEVDGAGLVARFHGRTLPLASVDGLSFYFSTDLWRGEPYSFEIAFGPDEAAPLGPAADLRIPFDCGNVVWTFTVHPAVRFPGSADDAHESGVVLAAFAALDREHTAMPRGTGGDFPAAVRHRRRGSPERVD